MVDGTNVSGRNVRCVLGRHMTNHEKGRKASIVECREQRQHKTSLEMNAEARSYSTLQIMLLKLVFLLEQ